MEEVIVNDGALTGGRSPLYILVAPNGEAMRFKYQTVKGVAAVIPGKYEKNGKWSNTDYRVVLAEGARIIEATAPLHGTICDNAGTWQEAADFCGLTVDQMKSLFKPDGPNAKRWNAVEEALASLKEA